MKKNIHAAAFLLLVAILVQSCVYIDSDEIEPRGPEKSYSYNLSTFDQIRASDALDIHILYGTTQKVEAVGSQKDLDDLNIRVENDRLTADYKNSWFSNRRRVDIYLTIPNVTAIDFAGAVQSNIIGFDDLSRLNIKLSGASEVAFSGRAAVLNFDLSGASELDLDGTGTLLDGKLSGASDLQALHFQVKEADLDLSGASEAKVWADNRLDVRASGASMVRYKGSPHITKDLSGGSEVRSN